MLAFGFGCAVVVFLSSKMSSSSPSSFRPLTERQQRLLLLCSRLFFNPTCRLLLETLTKEPLSSEVDHEELLSSSSSSSEEKLSKYSLDPQTAFASFSSSRSLSLLQLQIRSRRRWRRYRRYRCSRRCQQLLLLHLLFLSVILEVVCTVVVAMMVVVVVVAQLDFQPQDLLPHVFHLLRIFFPSRANSRSQLCATRIIDSDIDARWAKSLASFDSALICSCSCC